MTYYYIPQRSKPMIESPKGLTTLNEGNVKVPCVHTSIWKRFPSTLKCLNIRKMLLLCLSANNRPMHGCQHLLTEEGGGHSSVTLLSLSWLNLGSLPPALCHHIDCAFKHTNADKALFCQVLFYIFFLFCCQTIEPASKGP